MGIFDFLSSTVGVDIGSQNLRITTGDQIIFNEPSALSIDLSKSKLSGIGENIIHSDQHKVIWQANRVVAL